MEFLELGYGDERFQNSVDEDLHCPICMNVLKDPVQCGPNEHYFCSNCITRHLKNSQSCPFCVEELSQETLKPPSRFVNNRLNKLVIRCDYFERGCQDFVELEELSCHVKDCGFSPVECTNDGCSSVLNKCDVEHHEKEVCNFRKKRCADCEEMRKELDKVKMSLEEVRKQLKMVKQVPDPLVHIKDDLSNSSAYVREDMIILGGSLNNNSLLSSVEMFKWSTKKWTLLKPMKKSRSKASSFVYQNQVIATGGITTHSNQAGQSRTDTMESLSLAGDSFQWLDFPAVLPTKRNAHKSLVYQDCLLVIGGYDDKNGRLSDGIHEVHLKPPYSSKLLTRMPNRRRFHGAEIFGDKVVIAGGTPTGFVDDCLDSVLEYDTKKKKCRQLSSLPFPLTGMATVRWKDKIILIGGVNSGGERLDSVVMYDVKTGKSTMLPSLKHKREGCSAIATANVIVVMGGLNPQKGRLNSVEYFSFDSYSWEELPPMNVQRSYASAVVKPVEF